MSEAVFQAHVIQCAVENGFVLPPIAPESSKIMRRRRFLMVFHPYDSRKSTGQGYPDLTLCHPETGRIIFAELKKEGAYPTPEQRRWLEAFRKNPAPRRGRWKKCSDDDVDANRSQPTPTRSCFPRRGFQEDLARIEASSAPVLPPGPP